MRAVWWKRTSVSWRMSQKKERAAWLPCRDLPLEAAYTLGKANREGIVNVALQRRAFDG